MPEHIPYRTPGNKEAKAPVERPTPQRVMKVGALTSGASSLLVFAPALLDLGDIRKYFVAFGLVGVCIGIGFILNGGIDWLRRRQ